MNRTQRSSIPLFFYVSFESKLSVPRPTLGPSLGHGTDTRIFQTVTYSRLCAWRPRNPLKRLVEDWVAKATKISQYLYNMEGRLELEIPDEGMIR